MAAEILQGIQNRHADQGYNEYLGQEDDFNIKIFMRRNVLFHHPR